MEYNTLLLSTENGVCLMTINRPKALNALSEETSHELLHAMAAIEADPAIRVVIITGAGDKAFVAGADISEMATMTAEQARAFSILTGAISLAMERSHKVYIGAINGYALGGGCEFALGCDLRIASESARFGLPEVSLGVLPGAGGTQRMTRLIGP
ncbi:MAG: enoyl-CoA hydratase-related protein, partial [Oscillospiraceae bacterium]|nr:enoyl-CoA hydratase-related protein [Oscillospiraceae bacterium]